MNARSILLALAMTVTFAGPAGALTVESARPTALEARQAVHQVFDNYAGATTHRLVIGRCVPAGRLSRACPTRLTGKVPQRYRVVVTRLPESYIVAARLLR